jgi:polyhydroxyalkanoate synthesis repressor PhaR
MAKRPKKTTQNTADGIIIIKKYANRRLYDTEKSCYITLDDLSEMTRSGRHFQVLDAKTDEDLTHNVLTQIIMDEESRGQTLLPVDFLRQLISMYGDNMQAIVPQYLTASMEAFRQNQKQFQSALKGVLTSGPLGDIAKRNFDMFEAAAGALVPKILKPGASKPANPASKDDEIAALKAELEALKASLKS